MFVWVFFWFFDSHRIRTRTPNRSSSDDHSSRNAIELAPSLHPLPCPSTEVISPLAISIFFIHSWERFLWRSTSKSAHWPMEKVEILHLVLYVCPWHIMSSITLTNGARQKLQVSMTPAKTLAHALSEFCSKFDLDPAEHSLVHNKKPLDLSLAFRLSGISSNANLEVKKAATPSKTGTKHFCVELSHRSSFSPLSTLFKSLLPPFPLLRLCTNLWHPPFPIICR